MILSLLYDEIATKQSTRFEIIPNSLKDRILFRIFARRAVWFKIISSKLKASSV